MCRHRRSSSARPIDANPGHNFISLTKIFSVCACCKLSSKEKGLKRNRRRGYQKEFTVFSFIPEKKVATKTVEE